MALYEDLDTSVITQKVERDLQVACASKIMQSADRHFKCDCVRKARGDGTGMADSRRLVSETFPDEDTTGDSSILVSPAVVCSANGTLASRLQAAELTVSHRVLGSMDSSLGYHDIGSIIAVCTCS